MKDLTALTQPPRILVVEDDPIIRELLTDALADTGAFVRAVATAEQGLAVMAEQCWALLLTDIATPGSISGLELAWVTSEKHPDTAIILMSGGYDSKISQLPGGAQFMRKPWLLDELMTAVNDKIVTAIAVSGEQGESR